MKIAVEIFPLKTVRMSSPRFVVRSRSLAYLGWFGGAGPFYGPSLSVNKFFLTDILQFVPADSLGVGDVLQNRLNAALVGDAVHTHELLYVLALHLPGGDVPAPLGHLRIALLPELGLADDLVDGLCLGLLEDGRHLGPAVGPDVVCEELRRPPDQGK